ncbi:hypothetical protein ARMSODRAFT_952556 [Armillaria solidipes]|uniref:Aminoglycoside phosphotransferase domain-containing protein n=1 Tax=Armillaria solidipes TaxID=1076256 RepID=A0A2H3C9L6_9AGAR|nr:hypothetical protein ARMSODRAFT_952556 [Armillaria solidipes]
MAQLTVFIPSSIAAETETASELSFSSTLSSVPVLSLRVNVHSSVYNGPHSKVYRANVADTAVVLKISTNKQSFEDLTREADAYLGLLTPAQGSLIPLFLGYYQNDCQGCLILEDCGDPAAYLDFSELSREERKKILHVLVEFHRLTHHYPAGFAERNVVSLDGKYRLIDFHDLIKHECRPGTVAQMTWPTDLVCTYLSVAALDMGLFPEIEFPTVTIGNKSYFALSYPPKHIIDAILPDWFDPSLWWTTDRVINWLADVQDDYEAGLVDYETEEGRNQLKMRAPMPEPKPDYIH